MLEACPAQDRKLGPSRDTERRNLGLHSAILRVAKARCRFGFPETTSGSKSESR
jgi:hypothetical protein